MRSTICNFKCVHCIDHRFGTQIPQTKIKGKTWRKLLKLILKSEILSFHGLPFVFLAKELKVDGVKYYRLYEYEGLDWEVDTKGGWVFNCREECTKNFGAEDNREVERTRQAAENLGIVVEVPAALTGEELQEVPR